MEVSIMKIECKLAQSLMIHLYVCLLSSFFVFLECMTLAVEGFY